VGCIGMSRDDFCNCYYDEFEGICRAWRQMHEGQNREAWERARIVATIAIQPHVNKKITPQQLLPLPWDKKNTIRRGEAPKLTAEEQQKRFEEVARLLDGEQNS